MNEPFENALRKGENAGNRNVFYAIKVELFCIRSTKKVELFTKQQNYRLVQIESILQSKKIDMNKKLNLVLERVKNIVGKREKCWSPGFFFFSSPEHGVLSELLLSLTVRCCPSTIFLLTL